ncbi:helix-turn-helix transcriptional regulator [Rhizobium laguerreae]|nr:helix-turn-helix transcriptional regulator [Rhizobium laguerreae]
MDNLIRYYRMKAKMTQAQVAEKVGMSQPNFQRIEADMISPRPDQVEAIASALGCSVANLFPGREDEIDGRYWQFGVDIGSFQLRTVVTSANKSLIFKQLDGVGIWEGDFMIFDSLHSRHAVNLKHLGPTFIGEVEAPQHHDTPIEEDDGFLKYLAVGESATTPAPILPDTEVFARGKSGRTVNLQAFLVALNDTTMAVRPSFLSEQPGDSVIQWLPREKLAYVEVPLTYVDPRIAEATRNPDAKN